MILHILLFLVVVLTGYYIGKPFLFYLKRRRALKKLPNPDGGRFLIGHSLILDTDPVVFAKQLNGFCTQFRNEPLFAYWIGPFPAVVLNHPSMIETVLGGNEILSKSLHYDFLHPWLGLGLLTAPPERWRPRRKLLTPAFHFSILQRFYCIMNEHSQLLLEAVEKKIAVFQEDSKSPVIDMYPLFVSCAHDIICEVAMGYNLDSFRTPGSAYTKAVGKITDVVIERMKRPWLYSDFVFSLSALGKKHDRLLGVIHDFTANVIKERRIELKQSGTLNQELKLQENVKVWRLAFLDLLLLEQHENRSLSDADIQEKVDTFMFEGHDTTACAMTWCLYLLGLNPDVQKKLHDELDEVFPSRNCEVTSEHVGKLHYLDKVIKETLRLFPSVPYFARDVKSDFKLNGHTIPELTTLVVLPMGLHRNPAFFPDPEEFRPERFENAEHDLFSYIPFSAGSRNCIGAKFAQQELKVVLSWLLRVFLVKSQQPLHDCKPALDLLLRPSEGIFIHFEYRD